LISPTSAPKSDLIQAWRLRGRVTGDYVWFRDDGRRYFSTDPETIEQFRTLSAPAEVLEGGRRAQDEFVRLLKERVQRQEALKDRQIALADQDDKLRAEMAAESSPDRLDLLARREAAIVAEQESVSRDIRDPRHEAQGIQDIVKQEGLGPPRWPLLWLADIQKVTRAALSSGKATPVDQ
jgi:hypothetical protein